MATLKFLAAELRGVLGAVLTMICPDIKLSLDPD
jgi:hypothetical protein